MKPQAEDLSLRIKPQPRPGGGWFSWLNSRSVVVLVLFLGVVFLGVTALVLREAGTFARRRVEFPPRPQLDAAIAEAQERLKADPQDISALVELGSLHFEKGKEHYADGINELEEARDLGALDARIFYCLGIMYQEVGLYSFALEEYRRFLRHHPDDKEIRMLEAKLLYKQGNFSEAVGDYERLKYHHPQDALIEENLGLSLWGGKAVERAIESFNLLRAAGADPAKRAEFYLGQIYYEQGQFQTALDHLLKCQPQGGDFGIPPEKIHAALAMTHQKLGQLPEAKAAWEKVLAAVPGDAKAVAAVRELGRRISIKKKPITRKA